MGSTGEPGLDFDVLIIGAGLSGIFALHRMRGLGLRTRVLEYGSAEGGTWFWNRYPGCMQSVWAQSIAAIAKLSQADSIQRATPMLSPSIKRC